MSVINTNVNAIIAQNAGVKNSRMQTQAMQQLSTGNRINSAADDAAGLAISSKMTAQIRGLNQAVRNANDGISLIQTAEGALTEVSNMLQRMRELAVQSASDTNTSSDRTALNAEFVALRDEINRIGNNTQFNGMEVLNGQFDGGNGVGKFVFQVGANGGQTIDITMADYRTNDGSSTGTVTATTSTVNVEALTQDAVTASPQIDTVTLGGYFAAGDVITFSDGTNTSSYTVLAADITDGDQVATATAIATKIEDNITIAGLTIAAAGGTVTVTGASGYDNAFTLSTSVASSFALAGVSVDGVDAISAETTTFTFTDALAAKLAEGDTLDFAIGNETISYTVTAADVTAGTAAGLTANIETALNGALQTASVDGTTTAGTLVFTSTQFADQTDGSVSVTHNSAISRVTTASAADAQAAVSIAGVAQVDTISLAGAFEAGDVLTATIEGTDYSYTVLSSDTASTIATGLADAIGTAGGSLSTAATASDGDLTLTGLATGAALSSAVAVARIGQSASSGDLNMINSSDITTQNNANTAVGSIDEAIAVVSGGRATMGATINRLNYAADNLLATSANVSASRSRIQDTDYSQATTELARTQIIQQASTAMLAQANQSAQSVLSLLK